MDRIEPKKDREREREQKQKQKQYGVFPAILGIDIGAKVEEAFGDVDPSVERGDVEGSPVVVISGGDERGVFLEELADGRGIVLVSVPEDKGGATHPRLLLVLV